jgi:hypothetical protein
MTRVSKGAVYREKQSRTDVRIENTRETHGKVYTWTHSIREHRQKQNRSCDRTLAYVQEHMQHTSTVCGTECDPG